MSRHAGRAAARGTTVGFLRTGARPGVLGLLLAGLLLAAACGHTTSAAQTLRTCVDRWNQERPGCVVSLIFDRGTIACGSMRP